jgi:oligopeptide/dipeptide ABC transporter ATP-binding protein
VSRLLLEIEGLTVDFHTPEGLGRAVDHVSLSLEPGETLGLVGESGCGKSITSLSILGLVPSPPGDISSGRILFEGRDLLALPPEKIRAIRGREISMIFQEPMTSLNPILTIGRQVAEPLRVHKNMSRGEAREESLKWLEHVKIPAAARRMRDYPHQLSGGMRQRVMIAMAMACRPKLLIADEPTTALDVTIQSQILSLILRLKEELGMSMLLITHDLGVVAQMAGRVVVMYAGQVVEVARVKDLFEKPFHPYTRGLLRSIPRPGKIAGSGKQRLSEISGTVPPITEMAQGCSFAPRCRHAFAPCTAGKPDLLPVDDGHRARCWLMDHPGRRV